MYCLSIIITIIIVSVWPRRQRNDFLCPGLLGPVMLFSVKTIPYIPFAIGWEVPLVSRNTITHGGAWILVNRIDARLPVIWK